MDRQDRLNLINKIQKARNSKLIVYIAGERPNILVQIAGDIFPSLSEHLNNVGHQERIDLFLYSIGGDIMAGYTLVNLIREFCNEFNVIIPFKAHSCATLISLGAKEIVMTNMGQLSPIEPSLNNHPLAPMVQSPNQPMVQLPNQPKLQNVSINVEEVNAFISLAKEEFKLQSEESMRAVFSELSSKVHPVVLGAVHRLNQQIEFLASKLMRYNTPNNEEHIKEVIKILTRERFSHNYIIGKTEAKEELRLNIVEPNNELNSDIIHLFNTYFGMLKIGTPFAKKDKESYTTIIESSNLTHVSRPIFNEKGDITHSEWKIENNI
jgi:hypothetical protein